MAWCFGTDIWHFGWSCISDCNHGAGSWGKMIFSFPPCARAQSVRHKKKLLSRSCGVTQAVAPPGCHLAGIFFCLELGQRPIGLLGGGCGSCAMALWRCGAVALWPGSRPAALWRCGLAAGRRRGGAGALGRAQIAQATLQAGAKRSLPAWPCHCGVDSRHPSQPTAHGCGWVE
jgi:hypothetical protein